MRRSQNFAKSPPIICHMYCQSNNWWRFRKILWPSQNILNFTRIHCPREFSIPHSITYFNQAIHSTFQLNVSGLTLAVEQNIPKKCASKDLTTACPDKAVRIIDKTFHLTFINLKTYILFSVDYKICKHVDDNPQAYLVPHPEDCTKFYSCQNLGNFFIFKNKNISQKCFIFRIFLFFRLERGLYCSFDGLPSYNWI